MMIADDDEVKVEFYGKGDDDSVDDDDDDSITVTISRCSGRYSKECRRCWKEVVAGRAVPN